MWNLFLWAADINLSGIIDLLTGDFIELIVVVLVIGMIVGLFKKFRIR